MEFKVSAGREQQRDIFSIAARIRSTFGLSGFYGGLGWMALGRVPALGVRFGTYELLTAFYKDGREEKYVYAHEAFLAGFAAGALESFVVTPFDLFKVRSQASTFTRALSIDHILPLPQTPLIVSKLLPGFSPDKRQWERISRFLSALPNTHPKMISALQEYPWLITGSGQSPLVRDVKGPMASIYLEGWRVLWRGLRPSIFRDAFFGGFFFLSWQSLNDLMLDRKAFQMNLPPESIDETGPLSPLELSITAGLSGSVAALASHSYDTAKSQSQSIVTPKYISMERKLYKWKKPGSWYERFAGISPFDRRFLSHGRWIRAAQSGISCFALGTSSASAGLCNSGSSSATGDKGKVVYGNIENIPPLPKTYIKSPPKLKRKRGDEILQSRAVW
ncbi:uncharacterized protein LOC131065601 isoform X2 [Cryptomeria japonica]|uniref:uncharacterized protein LOC131065601 isoform X2 n=1 Tax=Cryptomeria japonica TaxID=3369 RepID=UPI0025ABA3C3|nr:uncharacterized protein LOC131065601 isoform X2 [Cryptomeria japonica]